MSTIFKSQVFIKYLTFIFIITSCFRGVAQEHLSPEMNIPVAHNGQYNVNHATGRLTYRIPLVTMSQDGVNIPVSLMYNAIGLRKEVLADNVDDTYGTDWFLSGGGFITRTLRGLDDLQNDYSINTEVANSTEAFVKDVNESRKDGEYDLFFANFNGRSVQFIMEWDGTTHYPVPVEETGLKIEYNKPLSGQFTITDENGIVYRFLSISLSYSRVNKNAATVSYTDETYIRTWSLNEIELVSGGKIFFEYKNHPYHITSVEDRFSVFNFPKQERVLVFMTESRHITPLQKMQEALNESNEIQMKWQSSYNEANEFLFRSALFIEDKINEVKESYDRKIATADDDKKEQYAKERDGKIKSIEERNIAEWHAESIKKVKKYSRNQTYQYNLFRAIQNYDPKNDHPDDIFHGIAAASEIRYANLHEYRDKLGTIPGEYSIRPYYFDIRPIVGKEIINDNLMLTSITTDYQRLEIEPGKWLLLKDIEGNTTKRVILEKRESGTAPQIWNKPQIKDKEHASVTLLKYVHFYNYDQNGKESQETITLDYWNEEHDQPLYFNVAEKNPYSSHFFREQPSAPIAGKALDYFGFYNGSLDLSSAAHYHINNKLLFPGPIASNKGYDYGKLFYYTQDQRGFDANTLFQTTKVYGGRTGSEDLDAFESNIINGAHAANSPIQVHEPSVKMNTLKAINYPYGGKVTLDYGVNEIHYGGINYEVGGLRIEQITVDDDNGNTRTMTYSYNGSNGASTGYFDPSASFTYGDVMTVDAGQVLPDVNFSSIPIRTNNHQVFSSGNNGLWYEYVEEHTQGNGSVLYHYLRVPNSVDATYGYADLNGTLLSRRTISESNEVLKEESYKYELEQIYYDNLPSDYQSHFQTTNNSKLLSVNNLQSDPYTTEDVGFLKFPGCELRLVDPHYDKKTFYDVMTGVERPEDENDPFYEQIGLKWNNLHMEPLGKLIGFSRIYKSLNSGEIKVYNIAVYQCYKEHVYDVNEKNIRENQQSVIHTNRNYVSSLGKAKRLIEKKIKDFETGVAMPTYNSGSTVTIPASGNPVITTETMTYDGSNRGVLPVTSKVVDSEGRAIITRYKYPYLYTTSDVLLPEIDAMKKRNMQVPVETQVWENKSGGEKKLRSSTVTKFKSFEKGSQKFVLPEETYLLPTNLAGQLTASQTNTEFSKTTFTKLFPFSSSSYQKDGEITYGSYETKILPESQKGRDEIPNIVIRDAYTGKVIVEATSLRADQIDAVDFMGAHSAKVKEKRDWNIELVEAYHKRFFEFWANVASPDGGSKNLKFVGNGLLSPIVDPATNFHNLSIKQSLDLIQNYVDNAAEYDMPFEQLVRSLKNDGGTFSLEEILENLKMDRLNMTKDYQATYYRFYLYGLVRLFSLADRNVPLVTNVSKGDFWMPLATAFFEIEDEIPEKYRIPAFRQVPDLIAALHELYYDNRSSWGEDDFLLKVTKDPGADYRLVGQYKRNSRTMSMFEANSIEINYNAIYQDDRKSATLTTSMDISEVPLDTWQNFYLDLDLSSLAGNQENIVGLEVSYEDFESNNRNYNISEGSVPELSGCGHSGTGSIEWYFYGLLIYFKWPIEVPK